MGDQPDVRYAELAHSVDLADITSDDNVDILRRLRDNDPELTELVICEDAGGAVAYQPWPDEDLGWAGHFIGENTHLQELALYPFLAETNDSLRAFFRGFSRNRSIRKLYMCGIGILSGDMAQFTSFLENNALHSIELEMCALGGNRIRSLTNGEGDKFLSQLLKSCKSVKVLHLRHCLAEGEELPTRIIKACGKLAQLVDLSLDGMNVGVTECKALTSLPIFCMLERLSLHQSWPVDGVTQVLTRALTRPSGGIWGRRLRASFRGVPKGVALKGGSKLRTLDLSYNRNINRFDMRGVQILAEMLEDPAIILEELNLLFSGVNDGGAAILARALANNSSLRRLILVAEEEFYANNFQLFRRDHKISARGWQAFANVLCNTSSVDGTYRSNHTLVSFSTTNNLRFDGDGIGRWEGVPIVGGGSDILSSLTSSLEMNRRDNVSTAKSKTIEQHLQRNKDLSDFADTLEREIMPHFIAWVPRDEPTLLYRLVRSMPVQFLGPDIRAPRYCRPLRRKRKKLGVGF